MPELQLCDFTGDGLNEVVLSNALQEEQTNVQVFRFNENDLKYSARQDVLEIYKIDVKWLDADWEGPD